MAGRLVRIIGTAALGVLCSAAWGCYASQCQRYTHRYAATLDNGRRIELSEYAQMDALRGGPEHNFATLTLTVANRDRSRTVGGEVARLNREGADRLAEFDFGPLQARANESRQKVWIVDTAVHRVVATLDCATGVRTGPCDDPPDWATVSGGTLLAADWRLE